MNEYYYISKKWTHKDDGFITLWKPNNCGYCWYKSWSGVYNEIQDTHTVKTVEKSIIDKLWTTIHFWGEDVEVLLNTPEVLESLGLTDNDFKRTYRSECLSKNQIK